MSAEETEELLPHIFRVLPLGDQPPFQQEVRNGIRYELDPPKGSVPPPKVEVLTDSKPMVQAHGKLLPFRLRLCSPSPLRRIKVGHEKALPIQIHGGEPWGILPLSEGQRSMIVAWRSPNTPWERPRFMALEDGPAAVPSESVRFLNLSGVPVGLQWGNSKFGLKPGKLVVHPFPEKAKRVVLTVFVPSADGEFQQTFSNVVVRDSSKMHQYFIYQTDGKGPRPPVRVVPLIEDRRSLSMPIDPASDANP